MPQAWFKGPGSSIPNSDLHHLFTCARACNQFRGSLPFADLATATAEELEGCGIRAAYRFMPQAGRGPAARAVLYFILRYPGYIQDALNEMQASSLATTLTWHRAQPVSEYELHRNAAIHEKQGNRNPIIDFPELAERVDFARGIF